MKKGITTTEMAANQAELFRLSAEYMRKGKIIYKENEKGSFIVELNCKSINEAKKFVRTDLKGKKVFVKRAG